MMRDALSWLGVIATLAFGTALWWALAVTDLSVWSL